MNNVDDRFTAAIICLTLAGLQLVIAFLLCFQILRETLWDNSSLRKRAICSPLNIVLMTGTLALLGDYVCNGVYYLVSTKKESVVLASWMYFISDMFLGVTVHCYLMFSWWRSEAVLMSVLGSQYKLLQMGIRMLPLALYGPVIPSFIVLAASPGLFDSDVLGEARFILFLIFGASATVMDVTFVSAFYTFLKRFHDQQGEDERFRIIARHGICTSSQGLASMAVYVIGVASPLREWRHVFYAASHGILAMVAVTMILMKMALQNASTTAHSQSKLSAKKLPAIGQLETGAQSRHVIVSHFTGDGVQTNRQ
ncbi:hypothetical protein HDU81_006501 [Chytriomyces hyalinus]|nr:hypothetical protein HDU81_006501 [Chytriomyces hyalinus]